MTKTGLEGYRAEREREREREDGGSEGKMRKQKKNEKRWLRSREDPCSQVFLAAVQSRVCLLDCHGVLNVKTEEVSVFPQDFECYQRFLSIRMVSNIVLAKCRSIVLVLYHIDMFACAVM